MVMSSKRKLPIEKLLVTATYCPLKKFRLKNAVASINATPPTATNVLRWLDCRQEGLYIN